MHWSRGGQSNARDSEEKEATKATLVLRANVAPVPIPTLLWPGQGERLGFLPATIPPTPPTLLFFPFSLWALSCEHRNLNLAKTLWGRHRKETEEAANQQRKQGYTSPPPLAGESNRQEKSRILPLSSWRHTSLGKSLFNVFPSPQPPTKSPLSQARAAGKRRLPEQGWPPQPGGALARSRVSRGGQEGTNPSLPAAWEKSWQRWAGREGPAAPRPPAPRPALWRLWLTPPECCWPRVESKTNTASPALPWACIKPQHHPCFAAIATLVHSWQQASAVVSGHMVTWAPHCPNSFSVSVQIFERKEISFLGESKWMSPQLWQQWHHCHQYEHKGDGRAAPSTGFLNYKKQPVRLQLLASCLLGEWHHKVWGPCFSRQAPSNPQGSPAHARAWCEQGGCWATGLWRIPSLCWSWIIYNQIWCT